MRVPLQIGVQSAEAKAPPVSVERLVNAYLENTPSSKAPTPVYGTPGLTLVTDMAVRGMLESRERLYAVNATHLVEVASNGTATNLGGIPGGVVDIASDGTNVVVTCGDEIYVWNGTTFTAISDEDAPAAASVEWMNGFFIFTETNTEQFFISPMNAPGGDYDALDFDSSDVQPDNLVRAKRVGRQLLMFGRQSVEFWFYSGDATFPFERYQDEPLGVGLVGVQAVTSTNETAFWLANDGTVRRLDGRTATRISTFAMEKIIAGWSDRSLTVVRDHTYEGHLFITFQNPEGCIVWDQATQRWHERKSYGSDTWRVAYAARCFDRNLFGGDKLYALGGYDENGAVLPFEMVMPWLDAGGERFSVNEVELRMETGVGSLTLDPKVLLERSEDGQTWSAPMVREIGKQGERYRRVLFTRQGQSRGCAFRVRITDPVKRVVMSAFADVA